MADFSISVVLDGILQFSAFILTCALLYFMLKASARGRFKPSFGRSAIICGAMVMARLYMTHAGWGANIVAALAALFALSFLLLIQIVKTPPLVGCVTAMVLVPLFLFAEQTTMRITATVFPDEPTFLEYMGLALDGDDEPLIQSSAPVQPKVEQRIVVVTNVVEVAAPTPEPIAPIQPHPPTTKPPELNPPSVAKPPSRAPVAPSPISPAPEPGPKPKTDPMLRITTHLGAVLVPNDDATMHEWIAAAHSLQVKGFVSLGTEVVILREDGSMLRKGEDWILEKGGYSYRFRIDSIAEGRVSMRANGRDEL